MSGAYRFGPFTVDVTRARLRRDEVEIALRPKSFALLHYLVGHADRLVTKDELHAALWPGLVVTDDSLTRCVSEVRAALGDGAQQTIRTVARRGYVFAEPVTAVGADDAPVVDRSRRPRRHVAAGIVAGVAALAIAALVVWQLRPAAEADRPRMTMVVLPFASLGDDPTQAFLADSITDDLTSALARLHGASVIATGTALTFKGRAIDPKAVGAELGVRYVLEGSVLRRADDIRINARLIDSASARSLWTDQFDVARSNWPKTQDEIVVRLASALDREMVVADSERAAHTPVGNLDAEDLALRCVAASAVKQGESGAPSFELCERALQLDPRNARALVQLALYYGERVERQQSPDPAADLARARDWAARALDAAPLFYGAHCATAVVLASDHKVREAIVAAERCRALNPSYARAYRTLAALHFFLGEPEKALEYADRGLRLSPRDPQLASFLLFKGWALMMMKRDEEAVTWLRQAAQVSPDSPSILAPLISAQALAGHEAEARETLARYLSLKRTRNRTLAQWSRSPDGGAGFAAFADRFKSGLRMAGMPEG